MGLEESLNPYLTKVFIQDGIQITCNGWGRLFWIQESVYREFCLEFFTTISFTRGDDYYNPDALTFSLGGEYRQCSMVELGWRMGFYDQSLVMTEAFGTFLDCCYKTFPKGMNFANWWPTIANNVYIPSAAQEGSIQSPIHRLINRLIACTVNMSKDDDKVPSHGVFYLWSIMIPNTFAIFLIVWRYTWEKER